MTLSEQDVAGFGDFLRRRRRAHLRSYAERLRGDYPDSAKVFEGMAREEDGHRQALIEAHTKRFGEVIPLIRREHVAGYYARKPMWLLRTSALKRSVWRLRRWNEAERFYTQAAKRSTDAGTRKLLGDLAAAEAGHQSMAGELTATHLGEDALASEEAQAKRQFLLTWVQPGLAGLMDGSVSTLAPIFATAFATAKHLDDVLGWPCRQCGCGHLDGVY